MNSEIVDSLPIDSQKEKYDPEKTYARHELAHIKGNQINYKY